MRRMKRKMEQDIRKGIYKKEPSLNIPTEEEVQEYISNKTKELRMTDPFDNMDEFFIQPVNVDTFPHKELIEWKNEEHLKLMNNEQVK
jgi:hypothetical protein